MADWKQITARIRRARTSKDPVAQLSNLFEKTRDAMVAFELARHCETTGQNAEAAKWYLAAAERFRRADWKTKAQEAAVRVGAELAQAASAGSSPESPSALDPATGSEVPSPEGEASTPIESSPTSADHSAEEAPAKPTGESTNAPGRSRRRGRRGGRNRRRSEPARTQAAPSASTPQPSESSASALEPSTEPTTSRRGAHSRAIPTLPFEPAADISSPSVRGRSGDPGLSSRLSLLEMQLRRLLTCPPAKLNEADHAPAGPGVFVLTDSDLTSYYYVEACQTLRIAIGNLLRSGASHRGGDSIKPRLAEHLGIPESRVTKYLADHCVVRWLQLDEGASHFAHFVIAVIRPTLNE
jgi:hypothetical protein